MKYNLAQNTIPEKDIDALADWLKTYPKLTMGPLVREFEEEWSKEIGVKYSVFCNSGSSANLLAYAALQNKRMSKKIALSAAGWITTLSPIIQLGMVPHLCEVDKDTFGMNISTLEYLLLSQKIDTVVLVHTLGVPNNMDEILQLKQKYKFVLMEDACPAVGSMYKDQYVGTFGDISTFSFYYGHQASTIEGGMVCTNDYYLYESLLMLRSHGWVRDLSEDVQTAYRRLEGVSEHQVLFTFYSTGFNLRSTELNAFLGLRQLQYLDDISVKRHTRFQEYRKNLKYDFIVQTPPNSSLVSCITFPCIAKNQDQFDHVLNTLKTYEIETRPISGGNLGEQPIWKEYAGREFTPHFAHQLHTLGFVLPCHPEISLEDVDFICEVIKGTNT